MVCEKTNIQLRVYFLPESRVTSILMAFFSACRGTNRILTPDPVFPNLHLSTALTN